MLAKLEDFQKDFNGTAAGGKKISLADLIVLGSSAAVEAAAQKADHKITVPFNPGRTDASPEQTDVNCFEVLGPAIDGFRNDNREGGEDHVANGMIDKASLLTLTAPK